MASESRQGRRRAASNAAISSASSSTRSGHARQQSKQVLQPRSSHTSDELLRDFLSPSFDPASYLNANLPPLAQKPPSTSASAAAAPGSDAVPLAELSSQAQTLLSQLSAQTTRLSNVLTQLTDDILRSGSRLAYEVELLRGEALSLEETMHETLQEEIKMFVPGGLKTGESAKDEPAAAAPTAAAGTAAKEEEDGRQQSDERTGTMNTADANGEDPVYIKQLQTLTLVRARLDSVIKTFGDAMDFVFPPSEVSVRSSFLSVSAPEPGSEQQSSEEKGQQVLRGLRDEISGLLSKSEDPVQGIEKALERIEGLKELATVWKGTAEEKGRNKFIESLARMVEDRHRELLRKMEQTAKRDASSAAASASASAATASRQGRGSVVVVKEAAATEDAKALAGGFGLISQLQKLRSGL